MWIIYFYLAVVFLAGYVIGRVTTKSEMKRYCRECGGPLRALVGHIKKEIR